MDFCGNLQINLEEGRIEKWVLRRAFDDEKQPYLPKVHHHFFLLVLLMLPYSLLSFCF